MKRASAFALTLLLLPQVAHADDFSACVDAAERGQQARDDKKLRVARDLFLRCSASHCPVAIRTDCLGWADEAQRAIPTVVFLADAGPGCPLTDVRVSVDGAVVQERIDGLGVPVDPGLRKVRFEWRGSVDEHSVVVAEGEKNHRISGTFDTGEPQTREEPRGRGAWPWIAGGVGVLGLGSFAAFGLSGRGDVNDLERCAPRCDPSDVDSARTKYLLADVSLGVAAVGFGLATYLFLRPTAETRAPLPTRRRVCP